MNTDVVILSRHESPNSRITTLEDGVIDHCMKHRFPCLCIPHFYHLAESSELWAELAEHADHSVLLGWLYPRSARWLLNRHKIDIEESRVINLGELSDIDAVAEAISKIRGSESAENGRGKKRGGEKTASPFAIEELKEKIHSRWHPVIDGSRCIHCGHCLQFCLFGVYETDSEGKVQVSNPDLCKTGCPACSRICPQSAIMFPLYEKDEAIAGAPGKFVVMNAAARKMYYTRTKLPCPVCGRKAEKETKEASTSASGEKICPECGRAMPDRKKREESAPSTNRLPFDDLDALVDRLDRETRKKSG